MSRKATPNPNAQAESFIKTLKYEKVYLFEYEINRASRTFPAFSRRFVRSWLFTASSLCCDIIFAAV